MAHPAQPADDQPPRMDAGRNDAQDEIHQPLQGETADADAFPLGPVGHVDADGAAVDQLAALVRAGGDQPPLVLRQAVADVQDGVLVGTGGDRQRTAARPSARRQDARIQVANRPVFGRRQNVGRQVDSVRCPVLFLQKKIKK